MIGDAGDPEADLTAHRHLGQGQAEAPVGDVVDPVHQGLGAAQPAR